MENDVKSGKTYKFKAEIKQLLDILVHSLYTSREIFLRELISNSSDALDKMRFELSRNSEVRNPELPLEIRITLNEAEKTLTIEDTGIGLTEQELIQNIGTIAKSSSAEFIKRLGENASEASNIIGRFGVGFYSVFMVAKEVEITTLSYKPGEKGVTWKSDGLGNYEITPAERELRGTTITVRLKDDAEDFCKEWKIEETITTHSNFISFPIYLKEKKVNTIAALWSQPKSQVSKEQYDEFYKFLTHDSEEPLDYLHISVEAPIQYNAVLYLPKKSFDLFGINREDRGLDLYVRKVLIQHKYKELLPEYLGFVKGVVDSEDLPLNISRETLQENTVFNKIVQNITTQVLNHLIKRGKEAPETFEKIWQEHGLHLKYGYSDFGNREKIAELLRFNSSATAAAELTCLEAYAGRMKDGQKEIYYVSGPSRGAILSSPHAEIFKAKGIEFLCLTDPVDEIVLNSLMKYKDFMFKAAEHADSKELEQFAAEATQKDAATPLTEADEKNFDLMLEEMKRILGERVTEARRSKRLLDSPACVVDPNDGFSATMQKILRAQNKDFSVPAKVFEVNAEHPLLREMLHIYSINPKDEFFSEITNQLFENALLIEGSLTDTHTAGGNMNALLTKTARLYNRVQENG